MNEISLKLDPNGRGWFLIEHDGERLAEMEILIEGKKLTVFHTEVAPKLRGQGIAERLLTTMVSYAREHQLKVIALCPYVSAQFKRHPERYNDVWDQDWRSK